MSWTKYSISRSSWRPRYRIFCPGHGLRILTAVIVYGGKKAGLEDKYVMVVSLAVLLVTVMSVYTGALTLVEIP